MRHASAHVPVMLAEVLAALLPRDGGIYVDATFGRGGYARALLDSARTRVVAIDRDPAAIEAGRAMAQDAGDRLDLVEGRFGDMAEILAARAIDAVDGVGFDLGVSSPQIDEPARGFSFRHEGPLDMRMEAAGESAADLVNRATEAELADMLLRLGEERHARRVARAIVAARAGKRIERTAELAEIVRRAVPRAADGLDPATRTFQALRIAVNDEFGELDRGLAAAEQVLKPGGRLAVVSFHSLEDRAVKQFLRRRSGGEAPSRHAPPPSASRPPSFRLVDRKAMRPGAAEIARNPRAASARLRVAERTAAPAWSGAHA